MDANFGLPPHGVFADNPLAKGIALKHLECNTLPAQGAFSFYVTTKQITGMIYCKDRTSNIAAIPLILHDRPLIRILELV